MGLKISYHFTFRGTKNELMCQLNDLRERFVDVPVERVREVREVEKVSFEQNSDFWEHMLGYMMLLNYYKHPGLGDTRLWDQRRDRIRKSANGLCFIVDIGPGCESFTVFLGRFGKGKVWRGMGCTKTQYAEHFVDAHLMVVRLLDICKEHGILERVNDDGGYWESRDLAVLGENINASTEFMKIAAKALPSILGKNILIVNNAVDKCVNYMQVKDEKKT